MRKNWLYSSSPESGGAGQTCCGDGYQLFGVSHCVGVFCLFVARDWKSIQLISDRGILNIGWSSGDVWFLESGFILLLSSPFLLLDTTNQGFPKDQAEAGDFLSQSILFTGEEIY